MAAISNVSGAAVVEAFCNRFVCSWELSFLGIQPIHHRRDLHGAKCISDLGTFICKVGQLMERIDGRSPAMISTRVSKNFVVRAHGGRNADNDLVDFVTDPAIPTAELLNATQDLGLQSGNLASA